MEFSFEQEKIFYITANQNDSDLQFSDGSNFEDFPFYFYKGQTSQILNYF